jgi:hypothetical protein
MFHPKADWCSIDRTKMVYSPFGKFGSKRVMELIRGPLCGKHTLPLAKEVSGSNLRMFVLRLWQFPQGWYFHLYYIQDYTWVHVEESCDHLAGMMTLTQ